MTLNRPFKCDPCYCPPLCTCNTQEMTISSEQKPIATAKESTGFCCSTGCCAREFTVENPSGDVVYVLKVNMCNSSTGGCNFCAPSCCNEARPSMSPRPREKR